MSSTIVHEAAPAEEIFEPAHDDPPPRILDYDDGHGDGDRWLTVASFWQSAEAHIARLKLESEQIDCVMINENLVVTFFANAVGGIKLQVRQGDFAKASDLLHRNRDASRQPPHHRPLRCPRCGSSEVNPQRCSRRLGLLSILLLGAPLPFLRPRQVCAACGLAWKPVNHDRHR